MYQVGGKVVGEADLVSSALSLHPQCTSNCGFIWYCTLQLWKDVYAPLLVYGKIIKYLLTDCVNLLSRNNDIMFM